MKNNQDISELYQDLIKVVPEIMIFTRTGKLLSEEGIPSEPDYKGAITASKVLPIIGIVEEIAKYFGDNNLIKCKKQTKIYFNNYAYYGIGNQPATYIAAVPNKKPLSVGQPKDIELDEIQRMTISAYMLHYNDLLIEHNLFTEPAIVVCNDDTAHIAPLVHDLSKFTYGEEKHILPLMISKTNPVETQDEVAKIIEIYRNRF